MEQAYTTKMKEAAMEAVHMKWKVTYMIAVHNPSPDVALRLQGLLHTQQENTLPLHSIASHTACRHTCMSVLRASTPLLTLDMAFSSLWSSAN